MEFIDTDNIPVLSNPGVESFQLLSPHNSSSERVTITKVFVQPGKSQGRHKHENSEQIWIALEGSAKLLLENEGTWVFKKGDIARFEDGDTHGLLNDSGQVFRYLAVTSPPINFEDGYEQKRD
ncbi:MAG: cupin domain-containing protein [Proteobacteria bacterium]|nr:cupin domain-containing protein [Pseudomonadota bacterium]